MIFHIFYSQPRKCATGVNQGQVQGPPLLPHLEPLLDLLLLSKTAVPALKGNRPDPGPALCVAGAAVQPLRLVGQQQACVAGKVDRVGEGTSKHSGSQAHEGWWGLLPKSWLEGTQWPQGKEGFNPAHSNMSPTQMGRLGQAKSQLLQLSSRQMARIFLEFPARWACRPSEIQKYTDTQVAAQVSR